MAIKYVPYYPSTIEGQAILDNFTRTQRVLKYRDNDKIYERLKRGMPLYEVEKIETVGKNENGNLIIRGECLSACAYLKEQGVEVDLVYVDPPFASGADYAKKIYIRKNPKVADAIAKAEEEMEDADLKNFEEKMYGDIWDKEKYLNWMYENLMAIKSVMSETATIYVHLDWHIGHYVKILMDEVFGEDNFLNEVIWCYSSMQKSKNNWNRKHDNIYVYNKSDKWIFNPLEVLEEYNPDYERRFKYTDKTGKYMIRGKGGSASPIHSQGDLTPEHEIKYPDWTYRQYFTGGALPKDWWELDFLNSNSNEKVSYSTQKPETLLQRIIKGSSNKEMVVADFFGGSGVTAKVSNDLGRKFIHCDIGINSIQTTRDRLVANKAEFDILEIKDGVSLFRNPVQTMDKLKGLITGLKNEDALNKFWEGAIQTANDGLIPIYLPNLIDSTTKLLDEGLMNRIIREAMPDLPDNTKKVIVYYIDIIDKVEVEKFIDENNDTNIDIELRDLKKLLSEVIVEDYAEFITSEVQKDLLKIWQVEITKFMSDRVNSKIDAYNEKSIATTVTNGKQPSIINISDEGLELIEYISLDCTNVEGVWRSETEILISNLGYITVNGTKTKNFWDGTITCDLKPLRLKIRNICGDENIFQL